MENIFGPGGLIAKYHPNYEYRPGQVKMAEAVAEVLSKGGHLLVEAGTGTGKTLAYLVPAIAANRRIIVSTGTKNLQEQLFFKDIPFLQQILPHHFRATYMKGRSNYVCLNRLKRAENSPVLGGLEEIDYFDQIRRWAYETQVGDRAELTDLPEDLSFWHAIDARSEICLGQKCPDFDPCFITKMRQRALDSDIVIVNHHLFFADLGLRGNDYGAVLPDYTTVIFDEAHEIENIAAGYFGANVSNYRLVDLVRDVQMMLIPDADVAAELIKVCARLIQRADRFWLSFRGGESSSDGRYAINRSDFVRTLTNGKSQPTALGENYLALDNALDRLISTLANIKDPPPELDNLLRRAEAIKFDLEFIIAGDDPKYVYWYERRGRGIFLQATPIDVSAILADRLFDKVRTAILTSATLTSGGSFDFIRSRLGINEAQELTVGSHFDYANQAVLYLPPRMPDPRNREFTDAAVTEIVKLLEVSRGRAFVLFTSNSQMQMVYERVRSIVDFPVFIQGQGSKAGLLEKFRNTPNAVLFATASFWHGVDVQGEALSCVIIDKLPFAVPTDPVVAARHKYIDGQGGNSFYEYSLPEAVITLKQGLGRLIRSTTDRGVLAVLDPRLRTKSYGRVFLESLPPCPVTTRIEDLARIFSGAPANLEGEEECSR